MYIYIYIWPPQPAAGFGRCGLEPAAAGPRDIICMIRV